MQHESFDALALDNPGRSLIIVNAVRCLSAPLRDATSSVVSATSTTATKQRLPDDAIPEKADLVTCAAERMSRALGTEGTMHDLFT